MLLTPALLLLVLAAPEGEMSLSPAVGFGLGYANAFPTECNSITPSPCASVQGLTMGFSGQLLYGGFLSGGARADLLWRPSANGVRSVLFSAVLRIGRRFFFDLGFGFGYAWARSTNPGPEGSETIATEDDFGPGFSGQLGFAIVEELAVVARAAALFGGNPTATSLLAAVEWRL